MADKALYIGTDATGKSVPLKAIDEGDGRYALKVTTTPGGGATYTPSLDFSDARNSMYFGGITWL